ncbi:uncharacterized protein LOC108668618 [Hyalella azteca]|uniref:Uncharacterized protein LOC108668618 n=1 Tax=Hyalella azteca TaxID=294128 RepID=A0A8B7NCM5_HYAAZ|nr:uncharacterized protein LOC108668618 [Hyalella azteca]
MEDAGEDISEKKCCKAACFYFLISPPGILKCLQVILLLLSLSLFLESGECRSSAVEEIMFLLPVSVCCLDSFVGICMAMYLLNKGRNLIADANWVKGDVLQCVAAIVLLVFGVSVTVFDYACITLPDSIAAVALSVVVILLYVVNAAIVWLLYVRHREKTGALNRRRRASQPAVVVQSSPVTMSHPAASPSVVKY